MTFKQKITGYLDSCGVSSKGISEIIEATKSLSDFVKWDDNTTDYPDTVLRVIVVSVNRQAIIWIDENCPKAWYRPLFLDQ